VFVVIGPSGQNRAAASGKVSNSSSLHSIGLGLAAILAGARGRRSALLLCLAYATVWVVLDVNRNIEADAIRSADRVVREVQELGWREFT
jgi:hypothetical protein